MKHICRGFPWVLTALLAGATGVAAAASAPAAGLPAEVDAYVREQMRDRAIPGLAVAVVREGRIVAAQAYGVANLELGVPVTLDTVFPIASLDKQLTASDVMLLAQDGKLRLDDEIGSYLPAPPRSWTGIRVRNLLSHTAGLPDVVEEEVGGRPFTTYSTEQLLDNVKRQSLLFPPGRGYLYSDAGLFLSQLIIEKASGVPWRRFTVDRLFKPAEMATATFLDPKTIIKNRVAGHALTPGGEIIATRREAIDFGPLYNDVGATVVDFARWAGALDGDRVLSSALRGQMWTPAVRANDALYWRNYGFGWGLDSYRGVKVVLHSGFTGVAILILPEQRTSVVVFTNLDNRFGSDAHGLALGIAGMYVPEVSLLAMPVRKDPDPGLTERVRDAFARLLRGEPDYSRYAPTLDGFVQEAVRNFETRAPHLGPLESLSFLGTEERDGDRLLYYRTTFAKGRFFVRVGFDAEGKIVCLQAMHV